MKALALAALLVGGTVNTPAPAAPKPAAARPACGDLLARFGRKPPHLQFVGCRYHPDRQGKPLAATYRVAGRHAATVESYWMRTLGMERLRRTCCVWDAPPISFNDPAGRYVEVTMGASESLVTDRARWRDLPWFGVQVELFTEDI